jgi:secreted trypsin-like serine protease
LSSEDPFFWAVYAGDVDLEGSGERHNAAEFVVHEDYDPDNQYINDIALIRVSFTQ